MPKKKKKKKTKTKTKKTKTKETKKITKRRRRYYVSLVVDDVFDDDDALDTTRVDDGLFRTNGKSETSCIYDKSAKGTTT